MKPPPTNPELLRQRAFAALMEDMFDLGAGKSRSFERTDALRSVVKGMKR